MTKRKHKGTNVYQSGGLKTDRLDLIRSHLYANGFSTIQDIADAVGASLATIRRDLQVLQESGAIDRVHGGARIADGSSVELAFQEREKRQLSAKRAIANVAYEQLAPRSAIFLDAGTTVLQLAKLIRINAMPLRIFTNGLIVAQEFMNVPNLEVVLLGGQLRSENASFVGPHAEAMLETIWFDQLFLGASAVSNDGAIYSVDSAEASLNRKMLARSADRFVLADSSKFGMHATHKVALLSSAKLITDAELSNDWRAMLTEFAVETLFADQGAKS
nr:DeoR/GlpR family DNA-binding transcription regulator [Rhizobium leguminosarum]